MLQVTDGDGEAVLPMAMLRQRFANLQELVGHSLYVTVTVLTESGVRGDLGTGTRLASCHSPRCTGMVWGYVGMNGGTEGPRWMGPVGTCGSGMGTGRYGDEDMWGCGLQK